MWNAIEEQRSLQYPLLIPPQDLHLVIPLAGYCWFMFPLLTYLLSQYFLFYPLILLSLLLIWTFGYQIILGIWYTHKLCECKHVLYLLRKRTILMVAAHYCIIESLSRRPLTCTCSRRWNLRAPISHSSHGIDLQLTQQAGRNSLFNSKTLLKLNSSMRIKSMYLSSWMRRFVIKSTGWQDQALIPLKYPKWIFSLLLI